MGDGGGLLNSLGVHVPDLVSGLSGGVVKTLFTQDAKPAEMIAAAIGGALTANYLSGTLAAAIGKFILNEPLNPGVSGFVVGLTAMTLCRWIIARVGAWVSSKATEANHDV